MTYIVPQPHKCVKCGHEFEFSPHNHHPSPTTSDGSPVCPKCWDEFLKGIGLGYCTIAWKKEGSDYEQAKLKEKNTK